MRTLIVTTVLVLFATTLHAAETVVPKDTRLVQAAKAGDGNFWFANSDLSGISIFEEAQYRGVRAAQSAIRALS